MNLQLLSMCLLSGVLLGAMATDLRSRRIPNALVLYGSALGLILQAVAPVGLFPGAEPGLLTGLLGGLTGLALFLPMYVLRLMGAGDVKLVAMTGVWLGSSGVTHAALWSLAAGGVLALVVALSGGVLRQVLRNLLRMASATALRAASRGFMVQASVQATGRLPYAVAIGTGTLVHLARQLST